MKELSQVRETERETDTETQTRPPHLHFRMNPKRTLFSDNSAKNRWTNVDEGCKCNKAVADSNEKALIWT